MNVFLTEICKRAILGQKDIYNPIYLYGDPEKVSRAMDVISTGWGMLHWEEPSYRTSGDDFFTDMVQALKKGGEEVDSFIASIKASGLLIFEGFEGIAGMDASMRAFYGIFDALYEHGGQILIGSRYPPSLLNNLADRVYTQISSGIVYCVDEEDFSAPVEDLEAAGLKIYQKRGDDKEPQKHKRIHALIETPDGFTMGIWGESWQDLAVKIKHIRSRGARIDRRTSR